MADIHLTKCQRKVLEHFADGRPIGPWPLAWGPYFMVKRLLALGLIDELLGGTTGRFIQWRITPAGRKALEEGQ